MKVFNRYTVGYLLLIVSAIIVGLFYLMVSPVTTSQETSGSHTFLILSQGNQSDIDRRVNFLIESNDQFVYVWEQAFGKGSVPPLVDFERDVVVASFYGKTTTGGHSVSVLDVRDVIATERRISFVYEKPAQQCFATQALEAPYQIIAVKKSELPVVKESIERETECR
jgi:hypothetical protein